MIRCNSGADGYSPDVKKIQIWAKTQVAHIVRTFMALPLLAGSSPVVLPYLYPEERSLGGVFLCPPRKELERCSKRCL